MENNMILRGDVFYLDLSLATTGSEQRGRRPVLVIQNNVGNRHSKTTIVAAITTKMKKELPTHVIIEVPGLNQQSTVLLEQLRTIDKARLIEYVGTLDRSIMNDINYALAVSTGVGTNTDAPLILCLCSACASQFYDSPDFHIARIDSMQLEKDVCTYCNSRQGYNYKIYRRFHTIKK